MRSKAPTRPRYLKLPGLSLASAALFALVALAACPKPQPAQTSASPGRDGNGGSKPETRFSPTWDLKVFKVNGIQVIHKNTPKKPVVALRVYFNGGSANLTPKTAGVEDLLLSTMEMGGSKTYPMDKLSTTLSRTGIQLQATAGQDYSVLAIKTTTHHFDTAWSILSDLIMNPALNSMALKVQKRRQIKAIRTRFDNPDSQISVVSEKFFFQGHPYSHLQMGTEKNVKRFTVDDLKAHHKKLLNPDKMVVVAVGDLDRRDLESKIQKAMGSLKAGAQPKPFPPAPKKKANRVKLVARSLPTNYVLGYFNAPAPGHPDYAATRIATAFLSDELFETLRTKKRLVYAISSGISVRRSNIGYIYLSTKKPNAAVKAALDKIKSLAAEGVSQQELDEMRSVFVTKRLLKLQTQGAQARLLGRAHLTAGDTNWAERSLVEMRNVSTADVSRMLDKYVKNIQFVLLGPSKVDSKAFRSGEPVVNPAK